MFTSTSLPNCENLRDVGGVKTDDGSIIASDGLYRSDNHDRMTPESVAKVRAGNIALILDLRWVWETMSHPSPLADHPGYRNIPLATEVDDPAAPRLDMDMYRSMIDEDAHRIAAIFKSMAKAMAANGTETGTESRTAPGSIMVHCFAGRDRTGLVIAAALHAAGVSVDAIADEYALTASAEKHIMVEVFEYFDKKYDGFTQYLLDAGVTVEEMGAVRRRLLDRKLTIEKYGDWTHDSYPPIL